MKTDYIELYTDYLISNNGKATATGLFAMTDNEVSHNQITRFLSKNEFASKELWKQVAKTVREVVSEEEYLKYLTTQYKRRNGTPRAFPHFVHGTDESNIICWYFDLKALLLVFIWIMSMMSLSFLVFMILFCIC